MELHDPARRAAAQREQATLAEPVDEPRGALGVGQLQTPQGAATAQAGGVRQRTRERRGDAPADLDGATGELLLRDDVEGGERCGAGERMGDEGPGVEGLAAAAPGLHQVGPADDRRNRQATAESLAAAQEIRAHGFVIAGEVAAGATETGEDLVEDQGGRGLVEMFRYQRERTGER